MLEEPGRVRERREQVESSERVLALTESIRTLLQPASRERVSSPKGKGHFKAHPEEASAEGTLVRRAEDFYAVEHGDCLHTLTGPTAAPGVEAKLRDAADNVRRNRTELDDDAALAALDTQVHEARDEAKQLRAKRDQAQRLLAELLEHYTAEVKRRDERMQLHVEAMEVRERAAAAQRLLAVEEGHAAAMAAKDEELQRMHEQLQAIREQHRSRNVQMDGIVYAERQQRDAQHLAHLRAGVEANQQLLDLQQLVDALQRDAATQHLRNDASVAVLRNELRAKERQSEVQRAAAEAEAKAGLAVAATNLARCREAAEKLNHRWRERLRHSQLATAFKLWRALRVRKGKDRAAAEQTHLQLASAREEMERKSKGQAELWKGRAQTERQRVEAAAEHNKYLNEQLRRMESEVRLAGGRVDGAHHAAAAWHAAPLKGMAAGHEDPWAFMADKENSFTGSRTVVVRKSLTVSDARRRDRSPAPLLHTMLP